MSKAAGGILGVVAVIVGAMGVVVILLLSVAMILSGALLFIQSILELALGVWEIFPWGGNKIIMGIEGNILGGLFDFVAGSLISGTGWGIFHFLFPEERKPKNLRRKRRGKKHHGTPPAAAPQGDK